MSVKADRARPVAAKREKRLDALGFPLWKTWHGSLREWTNNQPITSPNSAL